jgi:co-chaperonin GroES (HSP10)
VKPGDRVIYARVPDQEFEQDGVIHTFLFEEQHLMGILEPEEWHGAFQGQYS